MNVGFIGLGSMGLPMAQNLVAKGHSLTVWNRTREKAAPLVDKGARLADAPGEACRGAQVVITMLSDDHAVEEVVFEGGGLLGALEKDAVHACMSTISVALSRRLAKAHREAGRRYVAAPVFGRPEAAEAAKLWVVAAGLKGDVEHCRPVFDGVGQGTIVVGEDVGAANAVKIGGNLLLAAAIEAMGEVFALVRKHGVDPALFHEILNGKLFRSPIYENYGKLILSGKFEPAGFRLTHGLKDARLALEAGEDSATPLPLASLVRDHYLEALAQGWKDLDWAALAKVVARDAGLE